MLRIYIQQMYACAIEFAKKINQFKSSLKDEIKPSIKHQ